jgi:hypothetical protein
VQLLFYDFLQPVCEDLSIRSKVKIANYFHISYFALKHTEHNKKLWEGQIAYFPWYYTDRIEDESSNSSIVACVFVAAVTFFTEPLSSNNLGIHI